MADTKIRQLQPNANKVNKEDSGPKEELIERHEIPNSPFEVITTNGQSFGTMGNYRLTQPGTKKEIIMATGRVNTKGLNVLIEIFCSNNKLLEKLIKMFW